MRLGKIEKIEVYCPPPPTTAHLSHLPRHSSYHRTPPREGGECRMPNFCALRPTAHPISSPPTPQSPPPRAARAEARPLPSMHRSRCARAIWGSPELRLATASAEHARASASVLPLWPERPYPLTDKIRLNDWDLPTWLPIAWTSQAIETSCWNQPLHCL